MKSLKSAQAAVRGTKQKRNSADVAAEGESVVREFLKSAKGAAARHRIGNELAKSWGGEPDTAPVLRVLLKSAQAAVRGTEQKRNSTDFAAGGESVGREFLESPAV